MLLSAYSVNSKDLLELKGNLDFRSEVAKLLRGAKTEAPVPSVLDTDPLEWCDLGVASDVYSETTTDGMFTVTGFNFEKSGMNFIPEQVGTGRLTMLVDSSKFGGATIETYLLV